MWKITMKNTFSFSSQLLPMYYETVLNIVEFLVELYCFITNPKLVSFLLTFVHIFLDFLIHILFIFYVSQFVIFI